MQDQKSELVTVDIGATDDGLSVLLYRDDGTGPTVEDECWFTWDELNREKHTDGSAATFELEIGKNDSDGPREINTILAEIAALHKQIDRSKHPDVEEAAREQLATVRKELADRRQQRLETDRSDGRSPDNIDPRPVPPWIIAADGDSTVDLGDWR